MSSDKADYTPLDRPDVSSVVFYPRKEWMVGTVPANVKDLMIPVEEGISVGARFHAARKTQPTILYFHGNGEIVSDYDDLGPVYNQLGVNFFPVDYRGYGRSGGSPTVGAMMRDSHVIYRFVTGYLAENGYTGPLAVMGRSLGSASALELASRYGSAIAGLILESAFAFTLPLLRLLGVDVDRLQLAEDVAFNNLEKIRSYTGPTLVIHAERDHIIPFSDGKALYEASPAPEKMLLRIPRANHNDIFQHGMMEYMNAIRSFAQRLKEKDTGGGADRG